METVIEKTAEEVAEDEAAALATAEQAEAQALKEFTEGFTDEVVAPTEEEKKAAEKLAADEAAKAEADRLAAEAAKVPEPVFLTAADPLFQDLVTKAKSVDEIRALVDRVRDTTNGRVGSLEQTIKKLQEATPIGQAITVSAEDFAEIGKEMPEHAKMLADGLTRVLGKIKGTGAPVVSETPEEFEARVSAVADKRAQDRENARIKAIQDEARADLASVHPDWETIVGPKDSQTEFRKYLDTQPVLYKKKVLNTVEADVLAEAITKFKTIQEEKARAALKPKPKTNAREERLREAIPVRGGGAPLNTNREQTPEEAFAEGYNS